MKPLDDRVVVKPLESEEKTEGGILIPDTVKEKSQKGTIEAAGPGRLLDNGDRAPLAVQVSDVVLFGKYAGHDVKIDGVEYKIMKEADILAKIE